jgi:hypothetical protein
MMTIFLQITPAGFFASRLFVCELRLSELEVLINLSRSLSAVRAWLVFAELEVLELAAASIRYVLFMDFGACLA